MPSPACLFFLYDGILSERLVCDHPSRGCLNFYMLLGNITFSLQNMENSGACLDKFCRITMQPTQFELKLKTLPLLHRRDHFVFTRRFLKQVLYVITVSQIAC